MKKQSSMKAHKQALATTVNNAPCNILFTGGPSVVSKITARAHGIPLFQKEKPCKTCDKNMYININSSQWSSKGHHDGECYFCYCTRSSRRSSDIRKYHALYPNEKTRHDALVQIRFNLSVQHQVIHEIHHIVPRQFKNNYPQYIDPAHIENCDNKIVVTKNEHYQIHTLIRHGLDPFYAVLATVPPNELSLRTV